MAGGTFDSSRPRRLSGITPQEKRSLTHGDFWIPEAERRVYQRALNALNAAGVPYVVAGAYAVYEHTGIYRETKDLDVFVEPEQVVRSMTVLKAAGFIADLEQPHWLAKAKWPDDRHFVDIIFGMGNGLALIDHDWYVHSRPAILAATPVRVAPPEELLWHRLFIGERHRQDMADIVHLIVCVGSAMDWRRLVDKTGEHWPLLLAQLQIFRYVYPEFEGAVPGWVFDDLLQRARYDVGRPRTGEKVTRGTMISRFSFAIDVNEWGFRELREAFVARTESLPVIREIVASDVWDERSRATREYHARVG
ncbi:MAG TPA: nucleotidyltransferase family protein [Gemmatimonadaceae bacterium]